MVNFELAINPGKEYCDELIAMTAKTEGWAVTGNEYTEFFHGFEDGIINMYVYREVESKKMISAVITATYKSTTSSVKDVVAVGYYYVMPEYRGQKFGLELFKKAMEPAENANATLIGVEAMYQKYADKFGFRLLAQFTVDCYQIKIGDLDTSKLRQSLEGITVKDVNEVDVSKVLEFDRKIVPNHERSAYVEQCLYRSERQVVKIALDSQDKVVGYARLAALLNNKSGSIGPFYSDSFEIAEVLLAQLLNDNSFYQAWEELNPRIISSNGNALELFRKVSNDNLKLECSMHSQFTKELPSVPEEKVYGFFECGLSYI